MVSYDFLLDSVLKHPAKRYFLNLVIDGSHCWFYTALAQIDPFLDIEHLKNRMSESLRGYLDMYYRLCRNVGHTSDSHSDFWSKDDEYVEAAMIYLLKSLKGCVNEYTFLPMLIALWIELEHEEGSFDQYVCLKNGNSEEDRNASNNESYPFHLFNYAIPTLVARVNEDRGQKAMMAEAHGA
ncbi:MAG TPA: hypothetical protein PLN56_10695 [Methanoregulaceae archaeon]|nr:hypothetical protein [Sedimentisphaerales bacterium]HPD11446.1 hypothetical protein [Methanoregulaceae archaeon]